MLVSMAFNAWLACSKAAATPARSRALLLGWRKRDLDTIQAAKSQCQTLLPGTWVFRFNLAELLHKSYSHVACFGQSVLLTKADARTTVKGQISPAWTQSLPTLGFVFVCVRAIDILSTVHDIRRVPDHGAFGHEERMLAIGTTAKRQKGITDREARVSGDDWVCAKRYVIVRSLFVTKSPCINSHSFIHHWRYLRFLSSSYVGNRPSSDATSSLSFA
jgi:hypothetical protein